MKYSSKQQAICDYVNSISKGLITLSPKHCETIIKLSLQNHRNAYVEKWYYSVVRGGYQLQQTISMPDDVLNNLIRKTEHYKPVEFFYLYKCYNSSGEFVKSIYSLNPDLFD